MSEFKVILTSPDAEWSRMSMVAPSKGYCCYVCCKDNVPLLCTENSNGDNNWTTICETCTIDLFKKMKCR
jgi:hypothetical protein